MRGISFQKSAQLGFYFVNCHVRPEELEGRTIHLIFTYLFDLVTGNEDCFEGVESKPTLLYIDFNEKSNPGLRKNKLILTQNSNSVTAKIVYDVIVISRNSNKI